MNKLFLNTESHSMLASNKDVLSAFKPLADRQSTIQQGMSVQEIAEVVSDRVLAVIQDQFKATKAEFEAKNA